VSVTEGKRSSLEHLCVCGGGGSVIGYRDTVVQMSRRNSVEFWCVWLG